MIAEPFVLELLPARGLDQSMLLPVLVGLLVVLLCTETLGWVFAGAVVPGYLASVLVIQPVTGVIVIFESLVTLALSAMLAKGLSKTDAWTRFFGRERFFLILVVSLIVRMHDHAWFAPWVISSIDSALQSNYETQQEFYSVGLVLVPLTANMLWKPAIHRGLMQLGVQVGLTYLIVSVILLPYTNLSLSSVELTYENAAVNFVGHAKAHIILLTAALLAAQLNLTYGWDFNGILVPALLALLWLTPLKLAATLGEAVMVFYLTKGFLRLPYIRHMDFEGPRKIVLVFTLAFLWKVALGHMLVPRFPTLKISDTYGFGYLLSSLLAVKMLGQKSVRAVMLPSLFASAGGFVLGSLIGLALEVFAPQRVAPPPLSEPESTRLTTSPLGVMTLARIQDAVRQRAPSPPEAFELVQLREFWGRAATLQAGATPASPTLWGRPSGRRELDELRQLGASLGLQIVELGRYLRPREGGESESVEVREWLGIVAQGAGRERALVTGLLVPEATGPVMVVPMAEDEGVGEAGELAAPVAEAAAVACRRVDCRAVLVAGRASLDPVASESPLAISMAAFGEVPVVVVLSDPELGASAHIHQLRGSFRLPQLWGDYTLDWDRRDPRVQAPPGEGDFVLLRASPAALSEVVVEGAGEFARSMGSDAHDLYRDSEHEPTPGQLPLLLRAIAEKREPPGRAGAGYRAPSAAELYTLEQLVVAPLLDWIFARPLGTPLPSTVPIYAALLDYEVRELGDCSDPVGAKRCLIVLHERRRKTTAGWGTLVLRRWLEPENPGRDLVVEVPRPNREHHTWRVGFELWSTLDAWALLIAGADGLPLDPSAASTDPTRAGNEEGESPPNPDPVRPGNLETPFQVFHEAIDRSHSEGFQFVQIRGLASYRPITTDVVIGVGQPEAAGRVGEDCWGTLESPLREIVAEWDSCQLADGSEDLYILSGAGIPQVEYSRELGSGAGRVLWLSAGLRERFAAPRSTTVVRSSVVKGLAQVGFEIIDYGEAEPDDDDVLLGSEITALNGPLRPREPDELGLDGRPRRPVGLDSFDLAVRWATLYAETGNLHALRALRSLDATASDLRVEARVGLLTGLPYLLIEYVGEALGKRALVLLDYQLDGERRRGASEPSLTFHLRAALLERAQLIIVEDLEVAPALAVPPAAEEDDG